MPTTSRVEAGTHRRSRFRRALWVGVPMLGAVALGGCQLPAFGAFKGSTTQGQNTFRLWQGSVLAAILVGALVWALIFWSVIRYRKRDDRLPKQTREVFWLEVVYTVTPVLMVAALFFFTVVIENRVDHVSPDPAVNVRVTAFQWGWNFTYPSRGVSIVGNYDHNPTLVLPVGETVRVTLVSNDVVHGFYIPAFNFSRFAQPGITNVFDFNVTSPGTYTGRCTQYCGLYHTQMRFNVRAISIPAFDNWLSSQPIGKTAA